MKDPGTVPLRAPRFVPGNGIGGKCMVLDRECADAVEKQMGIPGIIAAYERDGVIKVEEAA